MINVPSRNMVIPYMSPVGELFIAFSNQGLIMLDWKNNPRSHHNLSCIESYLIVPSPDRVEEVISYLDNYFFGNEIPFNIPIDIIGSTFDVFVWKHLLNIPRGTVVSYSQFAGFLSIPSATRAVASAIARNRISIAVPCHRVIAAGNKIGGYAGGIPAKRFLLQLEGYQF